MKGICFIEPLFQAIIAGEKTQTRRIVPANGIQRYKEGDILYLKEPYYLVTDVNHAIVTIYKYNDDLIYPKINHWKNKLFMPQIYARYFIKITSVRKERLQSITDDDCVKEAAVQWLIDYAEREVPEYEIEHWIEDDFHKKRDNNGKSFCQNCGEKEVKKLKKDAKKEGASKEEIDDIFLNGWYDMENDNVPYCDICYKQLGTNMICDIEEYMKEMDFELTEETLYALKKRVIYDREKILAIQELPKKAYAFLIDKINGEGTWDSNPYVFVYDFQLFNDKEN